MNRHPVVFDADDGVFELLPSFVEIRRHEVDVVGLPGQRGITHIQGRRRSRVDTPALVVLALESERIDHLDLVSVLKINPAIAAVLYPSKWLERGEKFKVRGEIREAHFALAAGGEQVALVQVP